MWTLLGRLTSAPSPLPLSACFSELRVLEIRTDSNYVFLGFTPYPSNLKQVDPARLPNNDFVSLLRSKLLDIQSARYAGSQP